MVSRQDTDKPRPLMTETVEGKPVRVGERELVPLVQVTTYARRHAFIGSDRLAGRGGGFVRLRPIAILERDAAGEHRIPIHNRTARALGGLLLAALIIPLLLALAVHLTRRLRND
jgi:hypothetical protein